VPGLFLENTRPGQLTGLYVLTAFCFKTALLLACVLFSSAALSLFKRGNASIFRFAGIGIGFSITTAYWGEIVGACRVPVYFAGVNAFR
jgi:hypothetical protein